MKKLIIITLMLICLACQNEKEIGPIETDFVTPELIYVNAKGYKIFRFSPGGFSACFVESPTGEIVAVSQH